MRQLRPFGQVLALSALLVSCVSERVNAPLTVADATPAHLTLGPVLVITEIMPDPSKVADNLGEWIEIYNAGDAPADLQNWKLVSGVTATPESHTIASSVVVPSGGYVVLGNNGSSATNGGVTVNYSYPASGAGSIIFNNSNTDWVALKRPDNSVADSVAYSTRSGGAIVNPQFSPSAGISRVVIVADAGNADNTILANTAVWSNTPVGTTYGLGDRGTPGSGPYIGMTPIVVHHIDVTPVSASVAQGATEQFSAVAHDAAHAPLDVALTWTSSNSSITTVSSTGLATGVAPGVAEIRASAGGKTGFGTLTVEEAPVPGLPDVRFSEIHYDNFDVDMGEALEIEGPAGTNLTGWSVVLYNGNGGEAYDTRVLTQTLGNTCVGRGVVMLTYEQDGIQNGGSTSSPGADAMALVDATGTVVEFLSYEGVVTATDGPAAGKTSTNIGVQQSSSPLFQTLQRRPSGVWEGPKASTLGGCYGSTPVTPYNQLSFSGRSPFDPATPVGFEDQIFATLKDPSSATVSTTITWTSETPSIATIDADGVLRGIAPGTARFRAVASDAAGTTATYSLPIHVATSGGAAYANHVEFGIPTDGDDSDDYILSRTEFTSSFNKNRGIPNWVSFNIEATHFGPQDRCDCFTYDPMLPAEFQRYTTADYTGAGAFHGYGIDRGHLARSFDRTSGSLDNARSFYFSNIIPQAADNNQGPWANMENAIGNLARFDDKELFVIAGAYGSKGTIKGEGIITIPTHVWKVVVVLPRNQGLANVDSWDDLEVIAVIMPNDAGIRSIPNNVNDWKNYLVDVDAIEAASGYDLLKLLPDQVEIAVESNTKPPVAAINGPFTLDEGGSITASAAGSTDPDGDALTYAWNFGDGNTGAGLNASHTYAQQGTYAITLTVTDVRGLTSVVSTTATVANVAPAIAPIAGATILPGEAYSATGSFTDPGADTWSATVNYSDGDGEQALALSGKNFSLSHTYANAGTFTVTVSINDGTATSTRTATVVVDSWSTGIDKLGLMVASLGLPKGNANSLQVKLDAAQKQIETDRNNAPAHVLDAFVNELEAMVSSGRITSSAAAPLIAYAQRIVASITN